MQERGLDSHHRQQTSHGVVALGLQGPSIVRGGRQGVCLSLSQGHGAELGDPSGAATGTAHSPGSHPGGQQLQFRKLLILKTLGAEKRGKKALGAKKSSIYSPAQNQLVHAGAVSHKSCWHRGKQPCPCSRAAGPFVAYRSVGWLHVALLPVLLLLCLCWLAAACQLPLPHICLWLWTLASMAGVRGPAWGSRYPPRCLPC